MQLWIIENVPILLEDMRKLRLEVQLTRFLPWLCQTRLELRPTYECVLEGFFISETVKSVQKQAAMFALCEINRCSMIMKCAFHNGRDCF